MRGAPAVATGGVDSSSADIVNISKKNAPPPEKTVLTTDSKVTHEMGKMTVNKRMPIHL